MMVAALASTRMAPGRVGWAGETRSPRVWTRPQAPRSYGPEKEWRVTDKSSRDVLPIPDSPYEGDLPMDARDPGATFPPIEPLRPPDGAPNVLVVLLDDVGFAASSAFGGPCATPTAERLAADGLKFNRFHTTALC